MSNRKHRMRYAYVAPIAVAAALWSTAASAQVLAMASQPNSAPIVRAALPNGAQDGAQDSADAANSLAPRLHRQIVEYPTAEAPGTIIVDTPHTYLFFVLGGGRAIRYGIGVGREGFTWAGTKTIERMAEWPDWIPPADMLARQPYLPRFMAGGPGNPLGARAMYLAGTVYRIHGTSEPATIGKHVSSGCIRMLNEDVSDLYGRAHIGTKVVVLPMTQPDVASAGDARLPIAPRRAASFGSSNLY